MEASLQKVHVVVDQLSLSLLVTTEVDGPQKLLATDMFVVAVRSSTKIGRSVSVGLNVGDDASVSFPTYLSSLSSSLKANAVVDLQGVAWTRNMYEIILQAKRRSLQQEGGGGEGTMRRRLVSKETAEATFLLNANVLTVSLWSNGLRLNIQNTSKLMLFTMKKHQHLQDRRSERRAQRRSRRRRRASESESESESESTTTTETTSAKKKKKQLHYISL